MKHKSGKIRGLLGRYGHCLLLLYLPVYLICFFLLEQYTAPHYTEIYCRFDSYIPFNEYFVIPYLLWFPFILGGLVFFLYISLRRPDTKYDFIRLGFMLITGLSACLFIYLLFPNIQNLRPATYPNNNIFSQLCAMIQGIDPPNNVCPSMHVYTSLALFLVIWNSRYMNESARRKKLSRYLSLILTLFICASTLFIKQHSVVDVFWAVLLSIFVYLLSKVVIRQKSL